MQKVCLKVPHHKQQEEITCVPASVRMILSYFGHEISEQELSLLLITQPIGTFAEDVLRIKELGFIVNLGSASLAELKEAINAKQPVIAFLHTASLNYWTVNSAHALVVVGYDEDSIYVNDPYFDDAPIKISLDEFIMAWAQTDYLLALIHKDDRTSLVRGKFLGSDPK